VRLVPALTLALALSAACRGYEKTDRPMPELGLTTLDGRAISLQSMKGQPWVVNVWLPDCAPCAREAPALEAARREFEPAGVRFLALSLVPDRALTRRAAEAMQLSMEVATAAGPVLGPLGLREAPSTLFVSRDGRIVGLASGGRDRSFFEAHVRELIAR
jgi:peroxiredoxin